MDGLEVCLRRRIVQQCLRWDAPAIEAGAPHEVALEQHDRQAAGGSLLGSDVSARAASHDCDVIGHALLLSYVRSTPVLPAWAKGRYLHHAKARPSPRSGRDEARDVRGHVVRKAA